MTGSDSLATGADGGKLQGEFERRGGPSQADAEEATTRKKSCVGALIAGRQAISGNAPPNSPTSFPIGFASGISRGSRRPTRPIRVASTHHVATHPPLPALPAA